MNLKQINEFRAAHGLAPLAADPVKAAKNRRNEKNRQARGDADRALRAARGSNKSK